jgi:hypothetical protein
METITNQTTLNKELFGSKSIFENMYVFEKINPEKLYDIIHTADLITFNNKRYVDGIGSLYKTERDLLIAYQYQYVHPVEQFVSQWYLSKHGWGRIYPKDYLSMSVFHRPTRHTLCNDYLVDLDLVNCHYEIVLSYLKKLNLPYEHIEKYCNDVAYYRQHISQYYNVSKDTAKQLFIRLIYGGTINGWLKENNITTHKVPEIIENIADELDELIPVVWNGNQHIYTDIIHSNNKYFEGKSLSQKQRTVMSFWCQSLERYIQEKCIMYLATKYHISVCNFIPCQDGFMMCKNKFTNDMVSDINTYIIDELNMVSRFVQKPFNETYNVQKPSIYHVYRPFNIINSQDAQYASYLIDISFKYHHMISTGDDKHLEVYQYNGIYWEVLPIHNAEFHKGRLDYLQKWCEQRCIFAIDVITQYHKISNDATLENITQQIKSFEKVHDTQKIQELTKMEEALKKVKCYRVIMARLIDLSKMSTRKSIIEMYLSKIYISNIPWDANPELFAFNNCIMDLSTGQFVEPRKEQYIRTTCGWDWNRDYDTSRIEKITNLVNSILPIEPVKDYYLTYESTGLSGNKIQRVLISTGTGGNGKSLLRELGNKVKGDYGMKIPTDLLCSPIKGNAPNPVLSNMSGKRSLYFSEPNSGQKICSSTLKELTGDNTIVGRGLYSSKTDVNMIATLSGDCNTLPLFSDISPDSNNSLLRRLSIAPFITRAVSLEEYNNAVDKTHLNIRENFAENIHWMDEHKQAYFVILLHAYQRFKTIRNVLDDLPVECKNRAVAHLQASCDIMAWVNSEMEPCDIHTNKAYPLTMIYDKFKNNDRFKTFTKAEQRKYSRKYFVDLLENNPELKPNILDRKKYHNGVRLNSTCLVGYKFISYGIIEDDDDEEQFHT